MKRLAVKEIANLLVPSPTSPVSKADMATTDRATKPSSKAAAKKSSTAASAAPEKPVAADAKLLEPPPLVSLETPAPVPTAPPAPVADSPLAGSAMDAGNALAMVPVPVALGGAIVPAGMAKCCSCTQIVEMTTHLI